MQAQAGKAAFTPQQASSIAADFKTSVLQHLQLYRYLFTQHQEHDERSALLQVGLMTPGGLPVGSCTSNRWVRSTAPALHGLGQTLK